MQELEHWGANTLVAGWKDGMQLLLEKSTEEPTLQGVSDKTECGVWVALLAHMITRVRGGMVKATTAVEDINSLQGNVLMYRACMLDACVGAGM